MNGIEGATTVDQGKRVDGLRDAIFEHREVVLRQIRYKRPFSSRGMTSVVTWVTVARNVGACGCAGGGFCANERESWDARSKPVTSTSEKIDRRQRIQEL